MRAHPRVCGENSTRIRGRLRRAGSSPRVRGKHHPHQQPRTRKGLIPACAGKTRIDVAHAIQVPAHPRVCGENRVGGGGRWGYLGSSPRVRGKQRIYHSRNGTRRLIPACAGKTETSTARPEPVWAHPRVCGENTLIRPTICEVPGSSPRVRGKHANALTQGFLTRLIPACAGKTWITPPITLAAPAHPRVCGENSRERVFSSCNEGSSPRVRGKREETTRRLQEVRLIPACAGKTIFGSPLGKKAGAHPRVCGENGAWNCRGPTPAGSSPRVRENAAALPEFPQ